MDKLKKIGIIGVLTLSISTIAHARPFDGFYLGAGANLNSINGRATLDTGFYNATQNSGKKKMPLSSYDLGITTFGGYGKVFNQRFYLGGELFANYSPMHTKGLKHRATIKPFNHQILAEVKSYFDLGGGLRAGYLLSDNAMIYLLLAADYTQFKIHSNNTPDPNNIQYKVPNDSGKYTKNIIGFMPGIGMEVMLYKNLSLRAQYTYSIYPDFTDSFHLYEKKTNSPNIKKVTEKMKYDLSRSAFTLALSYHFIPKEAYYIPITNYDISTTSPFDGFYLGIGGNLLSLTGKADSTLSHEHAIHQYDSLNKYRLSSYNLGINAFGGYGGTYKNFYVGSALFAYYAPAESKVTLNTRDNGNPANSVRVKITSDYLLGGGMRFGYLLSPSTMIYALAAADFTQFKVNSEEGRGFDYQLFDNVSPRLNKNLVGFMPGIGIDAMINKHLSLRAQYTYTFYPSFTDNFIVYWKNKTTGTHQKIKYSPARNIFTLALTYYFGPSNF